MTSKANEAASYFLAYVTKFVKLVSFQGLRRYLCMRLYEKLVFL
jgi:hypothetical protein